MLSTALQSMTFTAASGKPEIPIEFDKFPFESEISQLTDDKTIKAPTSGASQAPVPTGTQKPASLGLPKPMHAQNQQNSNISPSQADLNMKIASCKKVWEEQMPTVLEHATQEDTILASNFVAQQHQQHLHQQYGGAGGHHHNPNLSPAPQSYSTFSQGGGNQVPISQAGGPQSGDHTALEHFNKSGGPDQVGDDQNSYPSPGQHGGQPNHMHPSQNPQVAANLQSLKAAEAFATTANVCKVKPTQQQLHQSGMGISPPPQLQQNTLQQQAYFQPSQYQMPNAIPSPPAVVFNPTIQSQAATAGLYNHYSLEPARTPIAHYGYHGTAANNTAMTYNTFMQTAAPNMQTAPTHDMYQNLSQYRATVQTPFNQTQQINNPNTVLISSTSNSLMSASVKSNNQQIGAIGSKSSANQPGQAAQSAYSAQQYMNLYQQHHPLQNPSYYTNSQGAQGNHYYGGPAATGTASQNVNYGLQTAGMFSGSNGPQQQMPNYGSHNQYLGSQLMSSLVAMNAQQYRGGPTVAPPVNAAAAAAAAVAAANNSNTGNSSQSGYMKQQSQSHMPPQDPVSSANFFKNNV
jgi:hypothetical protein